MEGCWEGSEDGCAEGCILGRLDGLEVGFEKHSDEPTVELVRAGHVEQIVEPADE